MSLEEGQGRYVASGLGSDFNTSLVDPDSSVGFETTLGRYFGCGKYGFGISYFNWNPGSESITRLGTIGTIRAAMPQYSGPLINVGAGGGPGNVYDHIDGTFDIDGTAAADGATGVRVTRNLLFQGIEANLFSFGLMGAQRAAYTNCGTSGLCHGAGFGGAAGPLVRSCSGRLRVSTSHGFRWFQVKDDMELAYNIDGTAGYQADDIYDQVETENNLFGYQFGGRLSYCMGSRFNLNLGGKFGMYGNRAEMKHRLGTETSLAYLTTSGVDDIYTESTDTVLSTMGELDLGLGVRICNGWTVNGGYRIMGITGVANANDSFPSNYSSVANSGQVFADDSYLLHGAYVGAEFNW